MDIEILAGRAGEALSELRALVQAPSKGKKSHEDQTAFIQKCKKLASSVDLSLEAYRCEQRSLAPDLKETHAQRLKAWEDELKKCRAQIEHKVIDLQTEERASASSSSPAQPQTGGLLTTEQAGEAAREIQGKSSQVLTQTLGVALQAEQQGIHIMESQAEQQEKLNCVQEENDDIAATLKRTKMLLGKIYVGARQDLCLQALCLLITIAIVVLVILAALGQDGGKLNVPDEVRNSGN
jgi:hypothetical protein